MLPEFQTRQRLDWQAVTGNNLGAVEGAAGGYGRQKGNDLVCTVP